jgi:catechol 2,3-dioxygenase-like lactoylglutathione lyase family enzyme
MTTRIDHVALEVGDLDPVVDELVAGLGLRVLRTGTRVGSGEPLVVLTDDWGVKLEIIATGRPGVRFAHVALDTDDVGAITAALHAVGWNVLKPARRIAAAGAESALVETAGLEVQLVSYDPDSVDHPRHARFTAGGSTSSRPDDPTRRSAT